SRFVCLLALLLHIAYFFLFALPCPGYMRAHNPSVLHLRFSLPAAAPTVISTLSLHDALPISCFSADLSMLLIDQQYSGSYCHRRSEEHTSELQSRFDLVCRLLLEKTKNHHTRRIQWFALGTP